MGYEWDRGRIWDRGVNGIGGSNGSKGDLCDHYYVSAICNLPLRSSLTLKKVFHWVSHVRGEVSATWRGDGGREGCSHFLQ